MDAHGEGHGLVMLWTCISMFFSVSVGKASGLMSVPTSLVVLSNFDVEAREESQYPV